MDPDKDGDDDEDGGDSNVMKITMRGWAEGCGDDYDADGDDNDDGKNVDAPA